MPLKTYQGSLGKLSLSDSLCPATNLAFEKFLLENLSEGERHLFLYRNDACIVMGRFQVPWREVSLEKADEKKIQLIRRRSGGGTVYHDPGNWNFCFLRGERELAREENLINVIQVLGNLGISVKMNERFDLVFPTGEGPKKISGSAFKQQKDRSYHHATLLVNASLSNLKGVLGKSPLWEVSGKGIASHPSPVTNLKEHHPLDYEDWLDEWMRFFQVKEEDFFEVSDSHSSIQKERQELLSWDWLWGETPENEISFSNKDCWIRNKKGQVFEASPELKTLVGIKLKNQNCEKVESLKALWSGLSEEEVRILTNLLKNYDR